ncbi:YdcF family protein [Actinoplanes sp. G11-F43]|uniref:YdcF family protein n=1 Tax=Actinoplanes sp. G11-F43 TaxID=3424130 RepID=UPI003D338010
MTTTPATIPFEHREDVERLWSYHNMGHELRPADVGIGLGSHDLGVAKIATELYFKKMYPWLVFTGANAPTTIERFPRGEAIHYREYAIDNGVPADSILVETEARNTSQNIEYTRAILKDHEIQANSIILMSRPYQQRRAYATCKKIWPKIDVICIALPISLEEYVANIGDSRKVIDMIVGDTQRIEVYAKLGFAISQHIPEDVKAAFSRLIEAGYTSRLI